ncbi:hypothetical protein SPBR_03628 [Sporothrix brasiliensis 5110]|uniref:Selenoprotein O n=1 Tax=Sporothrix brasiliensis 5110 TaxID=1398154 RepID=A0A0C2JDD4_9PEZI|nr:uncharacterized protein SPBR_03628 [Sporothrix brasiliensis 5110]KIH94962.1 hypothetical protein SPBR_03628 [Sporothrix brasiliensis 5110]
MASSPNDSGHTLASLPKTWRFTESLPTDLQFPTPLSSHRAVRTKLGPRLVRGALYTFVRPEHQENLELLAVSPAALRDLGLKQSEAGTDDFRQTVAGNKLWGWEGGEAAAEEEEGGGGGNQSAEQSEQQSQAASDLPSQSASKTGYPWAQCYGGYQFGQWAGQLGDGRAISLFEVPVSLDSKLPPVSQGASAQPPPTSYEIQLKGAGMTPYSRFADGRAVLRSSIREFVVSESLNALGIPSTRALALTLLPNVLVHRERLEPAAIVTRFAESWLRLGTFDLLRTRGDRPLTRQLADYVAETVYGGWDKLPGRLADKLSPDDDSVERLLHPPRGVPWDTIESPIEPDGPAAGTDENRYARLYREIVRRNARTVAHWQVYGFMNGVLNTDNTSVLGLSLDFGPFAFLDNFDPSYTPNHDDHHLRYSYRNQPSIIWWNLVRFGEALGELLAAGARVDEPSFIEEGIIGLAKADVLAAGGKIADVEAPSSTPTPQSQQAHASPATIPPSVERAAGELASHAEDIIMRVGEEYKNLFISEYKRLFMARLGLPAPAHKDLAATGDMDPLITGLLDVMEQIELDFNMFFRRLSSVRLADIETPEARRHTAEMFFYREGVTAAVSEEAGRRLVAEWLSDWRDRVVASDKAAAEADSSSRTTTTTTITTSEEREERRIRTMKAVNPNFVPRGWVLDEVIRRVERDGERDVLRRIMHMALHPFADEWNGQTFDGSSEPYQGDALEEVRWTQDVPEKQRAMQCSCSS